MEHASIDLANYTDRSRKVLTLARREAERLRHNYVGTEHLLLGMIAEGSGVGANVLKRLGVDLRNARTEVEKLLGHDKRIEPAESVVVNGD